MSETKRDYVIVHGQPPRGRPFQKSQSGNPRGPRPKSLPALLVGAPKEKVVATIDGERPEITKRQAVVTQLVNGSAGADLRATKMPIDMDMLKDAEKKVGMRRRGSSRVSTFRSVTLSYTPRATRHLAEIAEYSSARNSASARRIMSAHAFDRNFGSIEIECGMSRPTNIGCNRCAS